MPTTAEFKELFDNCTSEWTTVDGMYGLLFTSNVNGNTLFFPAAGNYDGTILNLRGSIGYYWSSSYYSVSNARMLRFSATEVFPQYDFPRHCGISVRAVRPA